MKKFVSLLRGINVSGQKKIKMDELKVMYLNLGFLNVETFIQSGNIVFESHISDKTEIKNLLEESINKHFGFDVPVHLLSKLEIEDVFKINPFLKKDSIPIEHLGITFLENYPDETSLQSISELSIAGKDEFQVIDICIFLLLPNGFGRTKLNNNFFERKLNTNATSRNWKTITRLREMIQ